MTGLKISESDFLIMTIACAVLSAIIVIPLVWVFNNELFRSAKWPITVTSGVVWGVFAVGLILGFWNLYYQYLYQPWMRWLSPLEVLFYGVIGLGMWWLAVRLPGSTVLWFVLLGGLEGVLEHVVGIYGMHILERVSWLQDITPLPVVAFSFFEYTFYWAMIAWTAYLAAKLFRLF
jgi:hypothetical protein